MARRSRSAFSRSTGNLSTIGRNGLHRYNNQDHSMLTALRAADNFLGAAHDVWSVNTDRSYHESFTRREIETSDHSFAADPN